MRNKIIFLDIDGVLCSLRSAMAFGGRPVVDSSSSWSKFDPVAVGLLKSAIVETGASVVLCSNWRHDANMPTLEYVLGINIMDVTRDHEDGDTRGDQIKDWLANHPEVERYAILDDKEDYYSGQMDHLCRTSTRNGFLLGHYEELVDLLGPDITFDAEPEMEAAMEEGEAVAAPESVLMLPLG